MLVIGPLHCPGCFTLLWLLLLLVYVDIFKVALLYYQILVLA